MRLTHEIDLEDENMNFDFGPSNHDSKAWSIMESWMSTCFDSHPQCNLSKTSTSYRPTRLLKLDNLHTFRLVLGTECPSTLQYVALSYCWGTKPVECLLRLLQSTFKDLRREQPVKTLPKTFRDAIDVAHRFGVDYIWIDRLCIFQDSPEDWQREASTMQDVYRNALFSISALGAKDDQDGCFFERNPRKVAPTVVSFKLTEDSEETAFICSVDKDSSWRLHFEDEPLVQRSWVVQERLLAPRTLHFGSKQLFWECREISCCEMHPRGVYRFKDGEIHMADRNRNHHFLWKQLLDAPVQKHASDRYEQLLSDWDVLTQYYVSRALTVPNDKLVALSGLANSMKARLQQLKPGPHRYLAGLWEENLMDTLMWSVKAPARRALQYRAPSWSWACLDGIIGLNRCENGGMIYFASIVSVEMTHPGKEDTGAVDGGILTLAGPCVLAKQEVWNHENIKFVQSMQGDDGSSVYEKREGDYFTRIHFDTLDDLNEEALVIWVHARPWFDAYWDCWGLALARVGEDKYRRLGMVTCPFNVEDAQALKAGLFQKQIRVI